MSVLAWGGSTFGLLVIGVCVVAFWRLHHLPGVLHPWLYRLATLGTYIGASACALTVFGSYALKIATWAASATPGGLAAGPVHVAVVIGGILLLADFLIAMTKAPGTNGLFPALALPLAAVLSAPAGHGALYNLLTFFPVVQWCADIAKWIG